MENKTLLPEKDAKYLTEAIRQQIGIYSLGDPDQTFVPNYNKIAKVLAQTEVSPNSSKMQFKISEVIYEKADGENINSQLLRADDGLQSDFRLRRVCKNELTDYQPNGFKRWLNLHEKNLYQKFAGKGFGLGLDSEVVCRSARDELVELLDASKNAGFDYFVMGVWDQQFEIRRKFGGGDIRVYKPLCFFPGVDMVTLDTDGKNHPRDMLQQFALAYQEPKMEEVKNLLLKKKII